jgi:hypothetical protein
MWRTRTRDCPITGLRQTCCCEGAAQRILQVLRPERAALRVAGTLRGRGALVPKRQRRCAYASRHCERTVTARAGLGRAGHMLSDRANSACIVAQP